MKHILLSLALLLTTAPAWAQADQPRQGTAPRHAAERKFQILVRHDPSPQKIKSYNERLRSLQSRKHGEATRGIGSLMKNAFGATLTQRTVGASTSLIELGVSYIASALRSNRKRWYQAAQRQCSFSRRLTTDEIINNFYGAPSLNGALDPENIVFQGFGCKNYLELKDQPDTGVEIFYVFCKLRDDTTGLKRMTDHSKFMVEIDSFMFAPKYCGLPNDSSGSADSHFDFKKRKDLSITIKVRLYSSWINEAIMVTQDQQLGEFTIQANIKEELLTGAGQVFIYDKDNPLHRELVRVDGDCFIVPRSFTGTLDGKEYARAWGLGQYRIEMDVMENCRIRDDYYYLAEQDRVKTEGAPDADDHKWDKKKWQPEWQQMKQGKSSNDFFGESWKAIVTSYKDKGWVTTLTDPISTAIGQYETQKLNNWLDLPQNQQAGAMAGAQAKTQAAGQSGQAKTLPPMPAKP